MVERRVNTDIRMVKIEKDIEYIKEKNEESEIRNVEENHELKELLTSFIQSADKKYATKFTEKAFWWTAATILTILIGIIFKYIFLNLGINL